MNHLVAHVVNAQSLETVEVEWEVASKSSSGQWWTNDGREIWPFWWISFDDLAVGFIHEDVTIPDGWIEHLQTLATKHASARPTLSLAEALGLNKPKPQAPIVRRI